MRLPALTFLSLFLCSLGFIWFPMPVSAETGAFVSASRAKEIRLLLAEWTLAGLEGRDWLISTKLSYRAELAQVAKKKGMRITLVDAPFMLLPEEVQEQIRSLGEEAVDAAMITPAAFAANWLETSPDGARAHIAFLDSPDIWRALGNEYVPSGLAYLGVVDEQSALLGIEEKAQKASLLWDEAGEFLLDSESDPSTPEVAELRLEIKSRMSRTANVWGVLLERAGKTEEAFDAFSRAYRLDSRNVVALMNKASLVKRGMSKASQAELVTQLNRHNADPGSDVFLWNLNIICGPVLHPEDYVPMGWVWALSAVSVADQERLKAGLEAVKEELRPRMAKLVEVSLARQTGMVKQSKTILEGLRNPETRGAAALAMFRDMLSSNADPAAKESWLKVAQKAGVPETDLALALMADFVSKQDMEGAKKVVAGALQKDAFNWILRRNMMNLQLMTKDAEGLKANLAFLREHEEAPAGLSDLAEGILASLEGKAEEARQAFLKALEFFPTDLMVLDPLLRLEVQGGLVESAKKRAEVVLGQAPTHGFANYVLGNAYFGEGRYEEAVRYLQQSVASDPQTYSLNDFSCALSELGQYDAAVQVAEVALQMEKGSPILYDTYACALLGVEKWEEAEKALNTAFELMKGQEAPEMMGVLNLRKAQVFLHKGMKKEASECLQKAGENRAHFTATENKLFESLEARLQETESPSKSAQ